MLTIPDDREMIEFLIAMLQDLQAAIRHRNAPAAHDTLTGIFERDQRSGTEIWRYIMTSYLGHLIEQANAGDQTARAALATVAEVLAR